MKPGAPDWRRVAPTAVAVAFGLAYVLVEPPSGDLAAHLFRAQLFSSDPFGIWNNYWYGGHHTVAYSLLYPAAAAALTPQIAAALAAVGTAAVFEPLAYERFGEGAWLGSCLFAAAIASELLAGRLAFAFGAFPAMAAVLALDRDRPWLAAALALLSAECSPVAALFAAVAGGAYLVGERRAGGALVGVAALAPIGVTALLFPEGGSEPFAFSAFWPLLLLAAGALLVVPRDASALRAGIVLYALVVLASYVIATPLGSNATRLGTLLAAPLLALVWWPRRAAVLALAAAPLLYLGWQAPIRDMSAAWGSPAVSTSYYRPLLSFLERQAGPPFQIEIPFTRFHWEAYAVASRFPIARGWERQLDIKDNALFYNGRLTAFTYENWLHRNAVRFVASSDAPLDYSARGEQRLIDGRLPYLHPVMRSAHWRVYAVSDPTPIAQGAARLQAMGPDWLTLYAPAAGTSLIRVHFTPYWAIAEGSGCVSPAGDFTRVTIRRPGEVKLVIRFALGRIRARSPRCRLTGTKSPRR